MTATFESRRYTQQIKLAEIGMKGQEKLFQARVLCVGAGGISATLLPYLAGAGIGTIGIIDDDSIEESNLHRQILYQERDINHSKATIAKLKLQALNSTIKITAHECRLTAENAQEIIRQYDLVADCSDNFYTRYLTHEICYRLDKPYFYASAYQFKGHLGLFYGKQNPCLQCLFPVIPDTVANCQNGAVLGTLPGLLGIIQATEIIKWITHSGISLLNRLLCIDLIPLEIKQVHLVKNEECQFCISGKSMENNLLRTPHETPDMLFLTVNSHNFFNFLEENPKTLLLDVRTVAEHHQNNLGGKLIPLDELPDRLNELDSSQTHLIYCQTGQRSKQAYLILKEAGFCSLYHLAHGIESFAI